MGPSKISIRISSVVTLMMIISSHLVLGHSPENPKDDLVDDDSLTDDGVFPQKLDDYEIEYKTPTPLEPVHFYETFDDVEIAQKRWITSQAHKEDNDNVFKYDGLWEFDLPERKIFPNDRGLILRSKAKHAAIAAKLSKKFDFNNKPLIVQYEVTFQNGMDCGGAYIKLLSDSRDLKLENFHDKTPYTIMFGPDKCGSDIKHHFIFRHKNPLDGTFEEKHAKRPSNRQEDSFTDKKPHLYKLVLKPDNRFEVFVDGLLINQGSLLEDMEPPVNPPIEIEDPNDKKPSDWDDREKIPDENSKKPDDWDEDAAPKIPDPSAKVPSGWLEDEPEMIPDPDAIMPEDWDESMDGDWEAPLIPNPKCEEAVGCGPWTAPLVENPNFKGRWQPPMVANPNYKGQWTRRRIPNPNYYEDKEPFKMTPIGAVGLEIWSMTDQVLFDNFIISDKESVVDDFTESTFNLKSRALERDSRGVFDRIINYSNSHPWLYAVYTIVFGLPIVLLIAFCCGGGSQDKKSDPAPTEEQEQENEHDHQQDGAEGTEVPPLRPSRKDGPLKRSRNTVTEGPAPHERTRPERLAPSFVARSKDDLEEEPMDEDDNSLAGGDAENDGEHELLPRRQEMNGEVRGENSEEEEEDDDENENEEEPDPDQEPEEELNGNVDNEDEVVDEIIPEPEQEAPAGLKKRRTRRD